MNTLQSQLREIIILKYPQHSHKQSLFSQRNICEKIRIQTVRDSIHDCSMIFTNGHLGLEVQRPIEIENFSTVKTYFLELSRMSQLTISNTLIDIFFTKTFSIETWSGTDFTLIFFFFFFFFFFFLLYGKNFLNKYLIKVSLQTKNTHNR